MIDKERLAELEHKQVRLINELSDVKMEIAGIFRPMPKFRVDAWDGSEEYEDGIQVIDAPAEKVEEIKIVESGHKGTFVILKDGKKLHLETYFTPDEIASIRKY